MATKPRACRSFGNRRLRCAATTASGGFQIAQAHRDRVGAKFFPPSETASSCKIFHVDAAFDSQAGAVILCAFAHVTAQQRRLVFSLGDAAALTARAQASSPAIPPALRRSFSVIGIELTGEQRRSFNALRKSPRASLSSMFGVGRWPPAS